MDFFATYRPRGLIFDFDGTLVDSMPALVAQLRDFAAGRGLSYDAELYHSYVVMGSVGFSAYLCERFALPESPQDITRLFLDQRLELYTAQIDFLPQAREFLRRAGKLGLPLGIATSSPRVMVESFLRTHQALDLFQALSFSDEVGASKEHPDVYLQAARQLGLKISDCAIFEDAAPALRTASRTGALVVAISDVRALPVPLPATREAAVASDLVVRGYSELLG